MTNKILLLLMFFYSGMLFAQDVKSPLRQYNIVAYGAKNDTTQLSTKAINNAINDCHNNGGGKVIIPAGKYVTGTLFLKSNVELHFENGAYLLASLDYDDFPIQPVTEYRSLKEGVGWSSLIYAVGAENIAITGNGTIDGRGKGRKGRINGVAGDANGRPRNILFISCKNVFVSDVKMLNSALWNQHYLDCEDVTVNNIKVYNHANGNNDGIDIDGCRRFVLSNSIIDSDDDGIVLKSTGEAACENIVVSNCIVSSFANAIKCGTESTGGFKNILITGCIVKPSRNKGERIIKSTPSGITAISLEIVDGGIMDGVLVNNILIEGTECPLYVRLGNRARKHIPEAPEPPVGQMRNIAISNITAYGTGNFGSSITGIADQKIENISLNNIRFVNKGGLQKGKFTDILKNQEKRHDMAGNSSPDSYLATFREVKEDDKGYPQPTVWGNLPSYGLFVRHVENLQLVNASFSSQKMDPRIPIIAVDVDKLLLKDIETVKSEKKADVVIVDVKQSKISKDLLVKEDK